MSEQNIKTVQGVFQAFGAGDLGFILNALAEDVTWQTHGDPDHSGHYGPRTGKAGVADFFTKLGGENDFKAFEPQSFDASGDKVFATGRSELVKRTTGKTVSERWIMMFTFRNGKIADWQEWDYSAGHYLAAS